MPPQRSQSTKVHRQTICRWAFIPIDEEKVSDSFDRESDNYRQHGTANCKDADGEAYYPYKEFKDEPMVVVRTYPNAQTALVNCLYYHKYGQHRCNLCWTKRWESECTPIQTFKR